MEKQCTIRLTPEIYVKFLQLPAWVNKQQVLRALFEWKYGKDVTRFAFRPYHRHRACPTITENSLMVAGFLQKCEGCIEVISNVLDPGIWG